MVINREPDLEVCGSAAGRTDGLEAFAGIKPELVILDLSLQEGNGLGLIRELRALEPGVKILVASMQDERLFAERTLRAGARGYLNKAEATSHIVPAIRTVLNGGVHLSPAMKNHLLCRSVGIADLTDAAVTTLSEREREVFQDIGRGHTTRQIAAKLGISPKTVETYRENIKVKLNIENSTELVQHAVQHVLETAQGRE